MTAALASAKVNVDRPHVEVAGVQSMRNSVEIKNSCNCFQNCFPCFKKKPKDDSRKVREDRTVEVSKSALRVSIDDLERSRNIPHDSGRSSRSSLTPREISSPHQLAVARQTSAEYKDPIIDVHVMTVGTQVDIYAIKELRAGDT